MRTVRMTYRFRLVAVTAAVVLFSVACGRREPPPTNDPPEVNPAAAEGAQLFPLPRMQTKDQAVGELLARRERDDQEYWGMEVLAQKYEKRVIDMWDTLRVSRDKFAVLEATLKSYLVVPYSSQLSRAWARIRWERRNRPIAVDDAWIAATAVSYNCPLVTHNSKDFTGISGLQVITELPPKG